MFPSNVGVDLRRLLALQLTVWTLESWIVSALVLVMPIAVTFQRETVQTPRAVVNRTHVSHRLPISESSMPRSENKHGPLNTSPKKSPQSQRGIVGSLKENIIYDSERRKKKRKRARMSGAR